MVVVIRILTFFLVCVLHLRVFVRVDHSERVVGLLTALGLGFASTVYLVGLLALL